MGLLSVLRQAVSEKAIAMTTATCPVCGTETMFPQLGLWYAIRDGDPRLRAALDRHYSARRYQDERRPRLSVGPGEKMVLMTSDSRAVFVWRKFISDNGQDGVNCAVFRNEAPELYLSSDLIREADELAWRRWPGERLYTYVNPRKVASANPGYCFLMAGWHKCGATKRGLIILEVFPDDE